MIIPKQNTKELAMTHRAPRPAQPRRWSSLALTSATLGLTVATPLLGGTFALPLAPATQGMPLLLAQEVEGEGGEAAAETQTQGEGSEAAVAEGGEGGEGGTASSGDETVDFLSGLMQIDGHLATAFALIDAGQAEQGFAHLAHPMAEVYEALEHELDDLGQPQFEDLLEGLVDAAIDGAGPEALLALQGDISARIEAAWQAAAANEPADGFAALRHLILKAGDEWSEGVAEGQIRELTEYQDAWGFLQAARARATLLATSPDSAVKSAAEATLVALDDLGQALPEVLPTGTIGGDAALFAAAAARIELAAYKVK
jgi:hypothetical protein